MAKINGITQKTRNPFVNLYELDSQKQEKKESIMWLPGQKIRKR